MLLWCRFILNLVRKYTFWLCTMHSSVLTFIKGTFAFQVHYSMLGWRTLEYTEQLYFKIKIINTCLFRAPILWYFRSTFFIKQKLTWERERDLNICLNIILQNGLCSILCVIAVLELQKLALHFYAFSTAYWINFVQVSFLNWIFKFCILPNDQSYLLFLFLLLFLPLHFHNTVLFKNQSSAFNFVKFQIWC